MTAENALVLLVVLVGILIWWCYTLNRRVHRLEQQAGLRPPERSISR